MRKKVIWIWQVRAKLGWTGKWGSSHYWMGVVGSTKKRTIKIWTNQCWFLWFRLKRANLTAGWTSELIENDFPNCFAMSERSHQINEQHVSYLKSTCVVFFVFWSCIKAHTMQSLNCKCRVFKSGLINYVDTKAFSHHKKNLPVKRLYGWCLSVWGTLPSWVLFGVV